MVELKATGLSSQQATQRAQSVFNNIEQSQKMIAELIIDDVKIKAARYAIRLQEAQALIAKADKADSLISAANLSTKHQIKYQIYELIRLNCLITLASSLQTRLVFPIYVLESHLSPKPAIALVVGLMGGIF